MEKHVIGLEYYNIIMERRVVFPEIYVDYTCLLHCTNMCLVKEGAKINDLSSFSNDISRAV